VPELGDLTRVDLRTVWANEAFDFTPWLRDDPSHLEAVLGIGIEITGSEHTVGGFKLDLIGRDLTHDAVLIIENQLESTDHSHLGQLMTYAAGTGAATVVWLASDFKEEHRQALDWLNALTDEETRFFGVRVEVVRIGDSLPAPNFEVVAMPNDWQKSVRSATASQRAGGGRGPVQTVRGAPWADEDLDLARDMWHKFSSRAQTLLGLLLERPGEKLPSNELQAVLGLTSPSQVAGVLSSPGIHCRRAGKALMFYWETGSDGQAHYWMDPSVAKVFDAARSQGP
jgi:hypothetical protein